MMKQMPVDITGIATAYDLNVTNDADINLARVQTGVVTNFWCQCNP